MKQHPNPAGIKIEDKSENLNNRDFRLYKIWTKKKTASEPYFITDSVGDLYERFYYDCQKWKIKMSKKDYQLFSNLEEKYNKQSNINNGQSTFFQS